VRVSSLMIIAGCVAALCTACSPREQGVIKLRSSACTDTNFVNSVQILNPGYYINQNAYSPPDQNVQHGVPLSSISSQAAADLTAAFDNAPPHFRHYLCGLDGIYISPPVVSPLPGGFDASWGFRSFILGATDVGSRYIAISAELWPSPTAHAMTFSAYENSILRYFANWSNGPSITTARPDTDWMTVLAALAHEAGHVRWAEVDTQRPGGNYDFSKLHGCSSAAGVRDFFINWNYAADTQLEPPGRYRNFGTQTNVAGVRADHANYPTFLDFSMAPNPNALNNLFYSLLQDNQPWPSAFGSVSPDEDFVETYVLRVLMGNRLDGTGPQYLQSLPITIPSNPTVDIPSDLLSGAKPELLRKATCVHTYDPP
jgi:hypothetical protein